MTDLLNEYEKSFRKNTDTIIKNFNLISLEPKQGNFNDHKLKINKSLLLEQNDKLIEEQNKLIRQMEVELSSLINKDYYEEFCVRISSFKKSLDLNKKKLNDLYSKEESKNSSFLSESNLLSEKNSTLLNKEKYLYQRSEKLLQARRSLTSTEEMGSNIIVNMDNQTKSMKNVTGKLKKMGSNLKESHKILNKMKKRTRKNKRIIIMLVILFMLLLISILSFKLYKKYK